MKKSELIKQLQAIPGDPEVALFDYLTNEDAGEGSQEGIYKDFQIEMQGKDEIPEGAEPWIALSFENKYASPAEVTEKAEKWDELKELLSSLTGGN